jgi:peroxiredoxin
MRNLIGQLTRNRILKITVISSLLSLIIFYVIHSNDQNLQPIYIDSFVLDDLDGQPLDILDLHNQQTLIINFWATWCAPCRKEMPLLNNYYLTKNADQANVLGIAIDEIDQVNSFIAELGIDFPVLVGQSEAYELMQTLGNTILTLPYTIVVNNEGRIIWSKSTEIKREDLEQIQQLQ